MARVSFEEKDIIDERSSLINDTSDSNRQESYGILFEMMKI